MQVNISPGTYIVAVSGGVDSVVLLDLLSRNRNLRLVVAHFDHGIRPDSHIDLEFVRGLAEGYGLPFVFNEGHLEANASEATAREARYKFLRSAKEAAAAKAIVTAHHQDDLIETAIINLLRGTGRKGLTSLNSNKDIIRPLLDYPKSDLKSYAKARGLKWREDSTNQDTKYLRNYVRKNIAGKLTPAQRKAFLEHLGQAKQSNQAIDAIIEASLKLNSKGRTLDREWFISLPHSVSMEMMAAWLRKNGLGSFDRKLLSKVVANAKTLAPRKKININNNATLEIGKDSLALAWRER